jgi:hypothetical protein
MFESILVELFIAPHSRGASCKHWNTLPGVNSLPYFTLKDNAKDRKGLKHRHPGVNVIKLFFFFYLSGGSY